MDPEERTALFRDLESDRSERKPSASQRRQIRQAICALANDLPGHGKSGVIFVGQEDDGSCSELTIDDELLVLLTQLGTDGQILPRPSLRVFKETLDGCEVACIEVDPTTAPPVRLRGTIWVRVGPSTHRASEAEEGRLLERRRAGDLPFDLTPIHRATLGDLDLDTFTREYVPGAIDEQRRAANQRTVEEQLTGLRLLTLDGVPTVVGILVLGKDPTAFVPGARIQFLRVDGTELSDPIKDQKEIAGAIGTQLRMVDEVLSAHVFEATNVEGGPREERRPDYPVEALRQLIHNAVAHRSYEGTNAPVRWTWYSDRVEIQSPGGPFGQVTLDNFGQPGVTDYRNPHLAEALKVLGFIQQFGMGIPLARRRLEENGNPAPDFDVRPTTVLAVVRRSL